MNSKVSIGISFKNPGRYFFELAIKSVFAQTFTEWELILLNDGSNDESLELAQSIKDDRVIVYSDGCSKGLNIRLNEMVQLARTPYFFRMDADDIMHPLRIEMQLQILEQHDDNVVIGSSAYSIDDKSAVIGFKKCQPSQYQGFNARYSFHHPTVAARTAWFKANPYNEDLKFNRGQDAELWCRTTATTIFINIKEPLLFYREVRSISLEKYLATQLGNFQIINLYCQKEPLKLVYFFTRELFRLWLFVLLTSINMSKTLISMRYSKIDIQSQNEANKLILNISNYSLPTNFT